MKSWYSDPAVLRRGPVSPTLMGSTGELRPQADRRRVDVVTPDVTFPVRATGGVDAHPGLRASGPPTT